MTQEDAMRDTSTNAGYTTTHTASTPVVCQPAAPVAAVEAIEACYVQWRSETDGEPQWSRLTTLIGATVARLLADAKAEGAREEREALKEHSDWLWGFFESWQECAPSVKGLKPLPDEVMTHLAIIRARATR